MMQPVRVPNRGPGALVWATRQDSVPLVLGHKASRRLRDKPPFLIEEPFHK